VRWAVSGAQQAASFSNSVRLGVKLKGGLLPSAQCFAGTKGDRATDGMAETRLRNF
jgi:hypothetical protein